MAFDNPQNSQTEKQIVDLIQQRLAKSTNEDMLKIFLKKFQTYYKEFKSNRIDCDCCTIPGKDLCEQMSDKLRPRECLVHHMYSNIETELTPYREKIERNGNIEYRDIIERIFKGAAQKIVAWENGTGGHMPSITTLKRVAEAFNCSISDLVSNKEEPFSNNNTFSVSESERKFFCGTYYIYSHRPYKEDFDVGLLSIVEDGQELQAYFRWKLDSNDKQSIIKNAQSAIEKGSAYFMYANDYKGKVQYVDGGLFITLDKITEANDSVQIIIPPLRIFHKQIENETGEIQLLCAGAGIVSTLQASIGRSPLAYTVCFSSTDAYLLEDNEIVGMMEDIFKQEQNSNGIQCIKMNMNAVETFIMSVNKKI